MLISWPVLASIAIFFASWMKPALPNGEWFQVHLTDIYPIHALLIFHSYTDSSCSAGYLSLHNRGWFIFAFVALAMNETPGLINFSTVCYK